MEVPEPSAAIEIGRAFTPPDATPEGLNLVWTERQRGDGGRALLEKVIVIPLVP